MKDDLSIGEVALGSLLDDSHSLHPDDVATAVARKGAIAGVDAIHLYLVDKQQRFLTPFPAGTEASLEINSTIAGRAYQRNEVLQVDGKVWFPLLDGGNRLGVMGAQLREPGAVALTRGRRIATLASELLVAKSLYGDTIVVGQRREPMDLAAELRWALLPPLTFSSPAVSVAGFLEPAYRIAGDAFDYAINGDTLHLAVFDAMGHGLAASRMANLALISYRHSRRRHLTLEETYRAMDEVLAEQIGPEAFVTAQLVTLDIRSGRIRWINAGHPQPLVLRRTSAQTRLSGSTSAPVGLAHGDGEVGEASLEPNDMLLFYSDGVSEARAPDGSEFGVDRLADLLTRASTTGEILAETVRRLAHAVLAHQQGHLDDDATLLLVEWPGRR